MTAASRDILRVVDANLNRIGEGLRVLEDVARLVLDDAATSQEIKDLRHRCVHTEWAVQRRMIEARDAAGDVGAELEAPGQNEGRDLPGTVAANSRRVQEALRVVEEMAKLSGVGLDSDNYKQARFTLYTLEKKILARLNTRQVRENGA